MGLIIHSESSRIRAAYVASGKFTHAQADARLLASRLNIVIDGACAHSISGQAALLTAISTASRCFGRVFVHCPDAPYSLNLPIKALNLSDAALYVGGTSLFAVASGPTIHIAAEAVTESERQDWAVRAFWDGWIGGVLPADDRRALGSSDCVLAGIAAGALAVAEAFLAEQGAPLAGRRPQLLSLWSCAVGNDLTNDGPRQFKFPAQLWLMGLGNLGQAYVWSISALAIEDPQATEVYLQDFDQVNRENFGTSVLVQKSQYGALKTKIAEAWLERCGYRVRRVDRRLDQHQRLSDEEPRIALLGLDRIRARRLIDAVGFRYAFDAGLGATLSSYRNVRLNLFEPIYRCDQHFEGVDDADASDTDSLIRDSYYQRLIAEGLTDRCGAAQLAGIPVAVPFVSAFAGSLTIAQLIRLASAESLCRSVQVTLGDLRTLRYTRGVEVEKRPSFATVNA
jgi:hypothetical protein